MWNNLFQVDITTNSDQFFKNIALLGSLVRSTKCTYKWYEWLTIHARFVQRRVGDLYMHVRERSDILYTVTHTNNQ